MGDVRTCVLDVIESQLAAYNARDAAAFAACYAMNVRVHDLETGTVRMEGIEAFTKAYIEAFAKWPQQRAQVVNRQLAGAFVIDTEYVTGVPGREPGHVVAIYRVVEGLIAEVWFTPRY